MKRTISLIMVLAALLLFAACGSQEVNSSNTQATPVITQANTQSAPSATEDTDAVQVIGYPKIEDIAWKFRNTVRYDEPVAAFDYVNNSEYTIVRFTFNFEMKEGVTSEQLQLMDPFTDSLVPDEEIPEM